MKKLLVYLRPYRLQAILAPCFKLLEAAFELLWPLIMADIIDVGISSGDTTYILKKCLVLVGLACAALPAPRARSIFPPRPRPARRAACAGALFAHIPVAVLRRA